MTNAEIAQWCTFFYYCIKVFDILIMNKCFHKIRFFITLKLKYDTEHCDFLFEGSVFMKQSTASSYFTSLIAWFWEQES